MIKYAYVLWVFFAINPVQAQVFKWTDSSGVVHFSDKPHEGAVQVELPNVQPSSLPPPNPTGEAPGAPLATPEATTYTVTISQPEDQATIRNNQGYVPVIVELEPKMATENKLQMIYDGSPLGEPQVAPVFALRDIPRGSHTIAVQLLNSAGEVISTSDSITFYLHRPMAGMVPQTKVPPRNT